MRAGHHDELLHEQRFPDTCPCIVWGLTQHAQRHVWIRPGGFCRGTQTQGVCFPLTCARTGGSYPGNPKLCREAATPRPSQKSLSSEDQGAHQDHQDNKMYPEEAPLAGQESLARSRPPSGTSPRSALAGLPGQLCPRSIPRLHCSTWQ